MMMRDDEEGLRNAELDAGAREARTRMKKMMAAQSSKK
jgi:hypothetical protein